MCAALCCCCLHSNALGHAPPQPTSWLLAAADKKGKLQLRAAGVGALAEASAGFLDDAVRPSLRPAERLHRAVCGPRT